MTQGRSNPWSTGPNTPAVRRRWQQAWRRARARSSGVQMDGGERLRRAGAHPRPFQQAAAARAAGDDGLELGSGGRSSGVLGFGVTRHSEISWGLYGLLGSLGALGGNERRWRSSGAQSSPSMAAAGARVRRGS